MNQTQICEILTSGQVMRLDDLQLNKANPILRVKEIFTMGVKHASYCIFGTMFLWMIM